jgi:Carboxypeptidase regulatory-like domain
MFNISTMKTRMMALCVCLALVGGATVRSLAQSTTQGGISGTVFDGSGAVVPNAKITIHNDATNADVTATSGESGEFRAPLLAPGTYTVTIAAPGFKEVRSSGVVVQVNAVTEVNSHLSTGSSTQTVEVTATFPILNFESPEISRHLDNREIEAIPINNRRWSSLALLTPGVTNDANGFGLIAFRAISPILNNVEIDGADDNQAFYGEERGRTRAGYSTSQIAIREFQVNSGVYSAEFGRAVGGVVDSVTKSGGNELHGEAYFYHRDSEWGAFNSYTLTTGYDPTTGITTQNHIKPKDKRNQYGFGVGGAFIKDKLFGFYAFDQYHRTFPGVAKANAASFFADPTSAQQIVLQNRLGLATQAAALTTYRTYVAALVGDLGLVPRSGSQTINTPKLDWQINGKEHASFLYHRLRWDSPGGVQTQQSNNYARDTYGTDFVKLDYGVGLLESLISAHLTNELRYQYGRELNDEGRQTTTPFTDQYLTPTSTPGSSVAIPVQISLPSPGFTLGTPYYSFRPALPDERKWQIGDTASWQLGNHSIKFGIDMLHNYDLSNYLFQQNGNYNYTSTLLNFISDLAKPSGSCDSGGSGFGTTPANSFPCYASYTTTLGAPVFDLATFDQGYFVQDDWKFRPNLTINIGLRYDYENLPMPYSALANAAVPQTSNHPSDKNNISPRVGFAWDPFGESKTAVRGGFGLYYGHLNNALILNALQNTGSSALCGNTYCGQLTLSVQPTQAGAPRLPNQILSGAGSPPSPEYLSSNLQNPYTEQFDFAVQQELPGGHVLSISYLGALGRELPNFLNLNLDPAATYTANYVVTGTGNCGPLPCGTVLPYKVYANRQYTSAAGATKFVTLNPAYNAISAVVSNVNSSFNGITVEMTKRGSKYIGYDANYTWSHALDFNQNQSTSVSTNSWFDPYGNTRANYANSYLDVRHRAIGWVILNVPGIESSPALRTLTDGWSIKPAVQVQSGLPYSVVVSGNAPNQCLSAAAGCYIGNSSGLSGTGVTYIPAIGRDTVQFPRSIEIDIRVEKDFKITERTSFQLLMESFNLANHQNVTGLNTSAYTLSASTTAAATGTLTYLPSFGTVANTNNNFAAGPRTIQLGGRLFF